MVFLPKVNSPGILQTFTRVRQIQPGTGALNHVPGIGILADRPDLLEGNLELPESQGILEQRPRFGTRVANYLCRMAATAESLFTRFIPSTFGTNSHGQAIFARRRFRAH